jgi:hypothetical protein
VQDGSVELVNDGLGHLPRYFGPPILNALMEAMTISYREAN